MNIDAFTIKWIQKLLSTKRSTHQTPIVLARIIHATSYFSIQAMIVNTPNLICILNFIMNTSCKSKLLPS